MSKAILVLDMPETCSECNLCDNDGYCVTNYYREFCHDREKTKQGWCPLRPMPEKMNCIPGEFEDGWNACIDAIGGGDCD